MNIYFSGLGGVAIGPLAEIAHDAGYSVQGSDLTENLVTRELQKRGIVVAIDQSGAFLQACHDERPIDWFVHTAALRDDHPELQLAKKLGIKISKRDELIAQIITEKNLKLLAVAGTHGKTSSTAMIVWTLKQLGVPVSYSIGTTLSWGPSGKFDPSSEYFVYECDEFDRNFLHFYPELAIITSIEYDHPDTYPTEEDYASAFRQFIHQSKASILWQHDADYTKTREASAWCLQDDEVRDLTLAGAHNRRNATLVLKALERLGIGENLDNQRALESFPGTMRRFEELATNLYTDYGHTPAEIAATLQMASELSDQVVLVYEPHQNIRQHEIHDQYTDAVFKDADEVYWLPTYLSREDPNLAILTPEQLTKNLDQTRIYMADLNDTLWSIIQQARDENKLVLCMGAGSIDSWVRRNELIKKVANVIVFNKDGDLVLQQRDNSPGINNPGMITGFGGGVNKDETIRQAAARELKEETNLDFSDNELEYFTDVYQPMVNDGQPRWVSYFLLKDQDISGLEVHEGAGYVQVQRSQDPSTVNFSATFREAFNRLPRD